MNNLCNGSTRHLVGLIAKYHSVLRLNRSYQEIAQRSCSHRAFPGEVSPANDDPDINQPATSFLKSASAAVCHNDVPRPIIRPAAPTRTEIKRFLEKNGVFYSVTEHTGFIQIDCDKCKSEDSVLISPIDGMVTCTWCHSRESFHEEFTTRISANPIDRSLRASKETSRQQQQEDKDKMDEDTDLYDRVSYLNLMDKEKNTKKKDRRMRVQDDSDAPSPRLSDSEVMVPNIPDPDIKFLWNESVDMSEMNNVDQNDMLQLRIMLGIERISSETLSRYNVRGNMNSYDQPAILYPRYRGMASRVRPPTGLKVIRKIGDRMEKENYPLPDELSSKQRFTGIFGYHMMTASDRVVVLTTNERDALAVYEATGGALAFALPQGEKIDNQVIPYLEDFDQIYIWFPTRHLDYAKDWGYALNGSRCYLIRNVERPIELVRSLKSKEVKIILNEEAVRLRDKGFRSMTDIREEIKADLINSSSRHFGLAQWKRFHPLNRYLGGFRPGELTVLTGGTGFGKTTFLCEYALDLFTQGVRTLFCSFEMPEEKILKWMLVQFAGLPLYRVEYNATIDSWLDKFERTKGPLTIMKVDEFVDKTVTQIAQAITEQVISGGCQHVVIDNLQFLVNQATMKDGVSSFDRFGYQDLFVGLLRKMATKYQVHVTMVVHPRKTDADTDLDIQHFGGSARVTQEADNVLALQRRRDERDRGKFRKFLYILKNRYGGRKVESDQLEMIFNSGTYTHSIVDHSNK